MYYKQLRIEFGNRRCASISFGKNETIGKLSLDSISRIDKIGAWCSRIMTT